MLSLLTLLACYGGSVVLRDEAPSPSDPVPTAVPDDTDDTDEPLPTGDTGHTDVPPFVEVALTEPWQDTLAFRSNVPRQVDDCSAVTGETCEDADADGLADRWEAAVLQALVPLVRFDESEPLLDDPDAVFVSIGRITPVGPRIRAYLVLAYHHDYGRCGLSSHPGDSERVALNLEVLGPGDVGIVGAYTAAHEGTGLTDHSTRFLGADLGELVFETVGGALRWVVFASDGKHATYGTVERCEQASLIPCIEEDCDPDGVPDPSLFERLPPVFDAGEPDTPLLTALDVLGFPGEQAWVDQQFCGGGDGLICAGSIRSKLTDDPFL